MPRFEIITTMQQDASAHQEQLFKTTTTHCLTGKQMMALIKEHRLMDWSAFAKKLVQKRVFGVDQNQAGDSKMIKFQKLDHRNDFVLYKEPQQLAQEDSIARNL